MKTKINANFYEFVPLLVTAAWMLCLMIAGGCPLPCGRPQTSPQLNIKILIMNTNHCAGEVFHLKVALSHREHQLILL